jgi:hypothetical protein
MRGCARRGQDAGQGGKSVLDPQIAESEREFGHLGVLEEVDQLPGGVGERLFAAKSREPAWPTPPS